MSDIILGSVTGIVGTIIGSIIGYILNYRMGRRLNVQNERLKALRMLWKVLPSDEYIEALYENDKKLFSGDLKGSIGFLAERGSKIARRVQQLSKDLREGIIEEGYDILLGDKLYTDIRRFIAETGGWKSRLFQERILGREARQEWNIDELYEYIEKFVRKIRMQIKKELSINSYF